MEQEFRDYLTEMKSAMTNPEKSTTTTSAHSICPKCNGMGWVLVIGDDGYEYAKECDCGLNERERQQNKLSFANVPLTYRDTRLKDFRLKYSENNKKVFKNIANSVKWWLENFDTMLAESKGLYLWSETKGSGKTMMLSAISNELIEQGKQVKFATSMQILNEIKASWDSDSDISESRLLRDLERVEILVIDDFGTERPKDWIEDRFYQIINQRYVERKMTLYSSNYSVNDLPYDDRIGNRIKERCFIIHFPEESVREYIARNENKMGELK